MKSLKKKVSNDQVKQTLEVFNSIWNTWYWVLDVARCAVTLSSIYLDDVVLGLCDEFVLEFLGHLRVEELCEGPLYGQGPLSVPLLHLMAELISVIELLDLIKVRLVTCKPGGEIGREGERKKWLWNNRAEAFSFVLNKPAEQTK